MSRIDRYLGSRILRALLRSALALALLFVFIDVTTHRRSEILQNQVPATVVAEYYLVLMPSLVTDFQIAALAMLASYLLVFGRAAQDREIMAMLAGGIGFFRFIRLPALIGLIVSFAVFATAETIGVSAAKRAAQIEAEYFDKDANAPPVPISWANLDGGWTCHVFAFDRDSLSGNGVLMLKLGESRVEQIEADSIIWDEARQRWMLDGGLWSVFFPQQGMEVETRRITFQPAPIAEDPQALFLSDKDPAAKTLRELKEQIAVARHRRVPTQRTEVDFHSRFAAPALSFIMMWIALPFALRMGRGGLAFSLVGCVGIGLAYLILYAAAIGLGNIGRLEPWVAAWLANAVFAAAALVMTLQTDT